MTPRKAKKISTPTPQELQVPDEKAGARSKRTTTRLIHQTLKQVLEKIEIIGNATASESQIQAATSALFTLIQMAKNALLCVTGAPGIISQIELEEFRTSCNAWCDRVFAEKMAVERAPFRDLGDRLNSRFEVGWIVEPGRFTMKRDRSGVIVIFDPSMEREWRRQDEARRVSARTSKIDTPSPEQLQAWFDLHSEPPQAEALPSGS
jgi:hypothetical protein